MEPILVCIIDFYITVFVSLFISNDFIELILYSDKKAETWITGGCVITRKLAHVITSEAR